MPDSTSRRSLSVLAVVVACFAVLWPKIFYPMLLSILFPHNNDKEIQDEIRKLNFDYMLHPQMREAMGESRPLDKSFKEGNKVLFHPSIQHAIKPQAKGAGAVNLMIPVYTILIILFFVYVFFKTMFRKYTEINPVYYSKSSMCSRNCMEIEESLNKRNDKSPERKAQRALEQYGKYRVITALKTIILEMEDFKGNRNERESS